MQNKWNAPGPRYPALLQLLRTAENLWNASHAFFARWRLSPSQFNVLNLLNDLPEGLSQTEISRQLIMHRSNVTGLIDRLEKRRLLRRHPLPGDRRAYRVVLTAAGHELLAKILPDYYRLAEQVWGDLTPSRAQQLLADLARVDGNLLHLKETLA